MGGFGRGGCQKVNVETVYVLYLSLNWFGQQPSILCLPGCSDVQLHLDHDSCVLWQVGDRCAFGCGWINRLLPSHRSPQPGEDEHTTQGLFAAMLV